MSGMAFQQAALYAALSPAAWYNIGLAVVLLALLLTVVLAYRTWHEVNEVIEPATPEELLASFEKARSEGELDDEEYARVRSMIQEAGSAVSKPKLSKHNDPTE